jgi:hypothetical protein
VSTRLNKHHGGAFAAYGGKRMHILALLFAAVPNFSPIIQPILDVLNAILWPIIAVVGSVGTVYLCSWE